MPSIIYPTGVESNTTKGTKIYLGLAKTSFKEQFRKQNEDLNYEHTEKAQTIKMYVVVKRGANNVWNQMVKC